MLFINTTDYLPTSEAVGVRLTIHDKEEFPFPVKIDCFLKKNKSIFRTPLDTPPPLDIFRLLELEWLEIDLFLEILISFSKN